MLRYHRLQRRISQLRQMLMVHKDEKRWWEHHVERLHMLAEALVLIIHPTPGHLLPVEVEIFMSLRLYTVATSSQTWKTSARAPAPRAARASRALHDVALQHFVRHRYSG